MKDLSKEFNQWHNALAPVAELFDPDAGSLQIKLCSTTDWTIFLAATPPVLAGVAFCLKGVNAILKELVEARTLIEQLIKKNLSKKAIEALEEENNSKLETELRQLADKTVEENYRGADAGRKNELKNAMGQSLQTIAHKITIGAKVELRLLPPKRGAAEAAEAALSAEQLEEVARLETLSLTLDQEIGLLNFDGAPGALPTLLAPIVTNPQTVSVEALAAAE